MNSKFFNNTEYPLIDKFEGIVENMPGFHSFLAVVGYFRSSGYFKLRKTLGDVKEIRIVVGINIDDIFRKHDKSLLMLGGDDEAKKQYAEGFIKDIIEAKYSADVEEGILQLCDDLISRRVQIRINKSKNLHAKFYLMLPEEHNEHSDGWVIMGSSNLSESGLGMTQPPRYELNVAMKDYEDVDYCHTEFEKLWEESIELTKDDIAVVRGKTHLDYLPTPYELYIKVLIDAFGSQVEDNFSMKMPDGYMELKYQKDAMIQGYQMLREYNGFFLADVVGTGKTIVGAMVAKRFIEENGRGTNVLVVYPPAVEQNWKDTFNDFGIKDYTQFVSNGSLEKVLEGKDRYKYAEDFDLIIVDEAHNFRSDSAERYDLLQRICKAPRINDGLVEGTEKKVMLLSATPLNNKPEDFHNLILLFQDDKNCNIDGIINLNAKFHPWEKRYKEIMKERRTADSVKLAELTAEVDKIYEEMRNDVLNKILVRRTRKNLINNKEYKADLDAQGIKFPNILAPNECVYKLEPTLAALFGFSMKMITDTYHAGINPRGMGLDYARYRAIEFLTDDAKKSKYKQAEHVAFLLASIYRTHMVKRLESSFSAFKKSLTTFRRITADMIKMFDEDKILIAPEFDVKGMMSDDMEIDEIIEKIVNKGVDKDDFVFNRKDFRPEFIGMLKKDLEKADILCTSWNSVNTDPKLDEFIKLINNELFDKGINATGKLVVFSESVDTLNYLDEELRKQLKRDDIIMVSSKNRNEKISHIQKNFDANYKKGEKLNQFNIILTSDVLAEGVNLHRSNVIVNYDSPWNATRLMQRIGRVNRIGSVADSIYNYMFYPSAEGNNQIQLYENALLKLQGFHSALGEDAQIYSREEMLRTFKLFDENVRDRIDKQLELLREIRELYAADRDLYRKIKNLPPKSRTVRNPENCQVESQSKASVVYITKGCKSQFYRVTDDTLEKLELVEAAEIMKADKTEPIGNFDAVREMHYSHVQKAFDDYIREDETNQSTPAITVKKSDNSTKALAFIRELKRAFRNDEVYDKILELEVLVNLGTFNRLTKGFNNLKRELTNLTKDGSKVTSHAPAILPKIEAMYDAYHFKKHNESAEDDTSDSIIVTSETFE